MVFDTALPTISLTITGSELFTVQFQVLDNTPEQIEIAFYESVHSSWAHRVYLGSSDHFGLGGTSKGSVPGAIGSWITFSFTPADVGLTAGEIITGMAWGVFQTPGGSTVLFSDSTNANATNTTVPTSGAFSAVAQDGSTGFYALNHVGPLLHVVSPGSSATSIAVPSTPSNSFTGMVYNTTNNIPYIIGNDGTIYKVQSGVVSSITGPPSGVVAPARQLFTDGTNLYTSFPGSNDVAVYNISGNSWTLHASPFAASLDTIYYSTTLGEVIAGGSNFIDLHTSAAISDIAYATTPNQMLVVNSPNTINIYTLTNGGFTLAQSISGTGAPKYVAVEPDGLQALVSDPTNNEIQVLINVAGTWTVGSPVSLTNPTSLAVYTSGNTEAIVCQTSANQVAILGRSVTTWSVVQTLTGISGPTSVAFSEVNGQLAAIVSTSTGVVFLSYNGAAWNNVGSVTGLSPVPTIVATDFVNTSNPLFYAAGSSGGNTTVYIFQNNAQVGSYTFSGTLGGLAVINYQVAVPTTSGALNVGYYVQGVTSNTVLSGVAPVSGATVAWVPSNPDYEPLLLVAGSNDIFALVNDKSESFAKTTDSFVATLSGSTWTSIDLTDRNKVSSITADTSGNIYAVNVENELYKISSSAIVSGYPQTILPPEGQLDGVPLGFSKLIVWQGQLVSAASLTGGLVFINGL